MRNITKLGSIIAAFTLINALASVAPASGFASKYFTVSGKVIQIDSKDRTLLVSDRSSKKLYLIEVQDGARFKITFGRYMRLAEPELQDVNTGERIEIRCVRPDKEHLARVSDGSYAVMLTTAP